MTTLGRSAPHPADERQGGTARPVGVREPAPPAPPARSPDVLPYLEVAAVTSLLTVWALRLQDATWSVPFYLFGDALAVQAHAKTVLETGWYEQQPMLGAPAGQQYHDFPTAENLHMLAFGGLGQLVDGAATVMNVYYVLGYPLAALTGLWFLRRCGVSRPTAAALAVLFALAPYHFQRNEGHLFLGSYYVLPPAVWVVVATLRGLPVWGRSRRVRGPLGLVCGPGALTVAAMALLGTASTYYSVFVALLLGAAGVVALVRDRRWGAFAGAVGAGAALVATMAANMAPDLLYARGRPPNLVALTRFASEAEIYALKLVQLVLPSPQHRFGPLRRLRAEYDREFPLPSEAPTLGAVAAVGFVVLLLVVAAAAAGSVRGDGRYGEGPRGGGRSLGGRRGATLRALAVLALVAFVTATVGGVSSVLAVFVTDDLRGWGRMTIVIALLALAAVGLVVDAGVEAVGRRSPDVRPVLAAAAATTLLIVGVVDQTGPGSAPDHLANQVTWASDEAYVQALEARLPARAMVFQLPHIPFPEAQPVDGVGSTDQLAMYLHSRDLRWSGGGMKGRPEVDWAALTAARPVPELVDRLALVGFAGVHVDAYAFADRGAVLAADLGTLLGPPTATSQDGRYRFWPLAPAADGLGALPGGQAGAEALRTAVLLPVVAYPQPDFLGPADEGGRQRWSSRAGEAAIALDNPRQGDVRVRLVLTVRSPTGVPTVDVTLPGGDRRSLDLRPEATVAATLDLPPGRSTLTLAPAQALVADGAVDLWAARLEVLDLRVEDPALDGAFVR